MRFAALYPLGRLSPMTAPKPIAVVLLSGGLDSAVTAAVALRDGFEVAALTIDYGQRHAIEVDAARRVCASLGVARHIVLRLDLRAFGGSALTDEIEVPKRLHPPAPSSFLRNKEGENVTFLRNEEGENAKFLGSEDGETVAVLGNEEGENATFLGNEKGETAAENMEAAAIPVTYVPARNTIFLSLALGWAEALGSQDLFIGVNALDYSGYPDCRPEFVEAFRRLANVATKAGVEGAEIRVHAPLQHMTKAEIVRLGMELGVDVSLTTSCYDPGEEGQPCGACDSCLLRAKGFAEAGVPDGR